MTGTDMNRSTLLAYAASIAVIAGLMTVVALGGSAFTSKPTSIGFTSAHVTAQK